MTRIKKKGKNKFIIPVIIVLVIILGIGGYFMYDKYQKDLIEKNSVHITYNNLSVEINEEVLISSFIKEVTNGILIASDDKLDTSHLGSKEVSITIKNKEDEEEKHTFKVDIVDTTKPEIVAKKEINSYVGRDIDLLKDVQVTDNSKEEIKAKVLGDYDINKEGNYNLKYEAIDSSGNKGEFDFILNIISDPNNRVFTTSKGFSAKVVDGITYVDGVLIANKTYSLPSSYAPGLQSSIQTAFNNLKSDASSEGYNLYIGSGYRSYWDQKIIYNNYVSWDGQANADTYSARPGHSEHQTGLAIDVCDHNESACISSAFDSTAQAKWLNDNCYKYGLIIRYPKDKSNITGYMYESWHLRYVGTELATKLYNDGNWITLEEYYGIDSKYS